MDPPPCPSTREGSMMYWGFGHELVDTTPSPCGRAGVGSAVCWSVVYLFCSLSILSISFCKDMGKGSSRCLWQAMSRVYMRPMQ